MQDADSLWVVVEVFAGIPVAVGAYRDRQAAQDWERFLRMHMSPERDETGVFEVHVDEPPLCGSGSWLSEYPGMEATSGK